MISRPPRSLGDADHAAVDMFGHAGDHEFGRLAEPLRPILPHQIMIAPDAAGRDDHGLRAEGEIADDVARGTLAALDRGRFQDHAADAVDRTVGDAERIDAVTELEYQPSALRGLARAALERLDDAGSGAPGDVEARHRIAMAHRVVTAALGPADHREDAMAHGAQPVAFLARRECDIGFSPFARPVILLAIETGGAHPVLQREVDRILDAEPTLLRRIDQEQAAKRPEGLAADALFPFLVEHDDALACFGNLGCGDETGKPRANHDHICILSHV
ncbi:hypothetical protein ACVWYP_000327 [Bradyrhizobium sp. USDA 3262]